MGYIGYGWLSGLIWFREYKNGKPTDYLISNTGLRRKAEFKSLYFS